MSDHTSSDAVQAREPLSFETDPGAGRSFWTALAILIAIILWMASGMLGSDDADTMAQDTREPLPSSVVIRSSTAETVELSFRAQGQAMPERDSQVVTEASGTISSIPVEKGQSVKRGDVIARFVSTRADATLEQAEAERRRAQRELDNATTLVDRGVGTVDRLASARATLAAAEAQVTSAQETLDNLTVTAPFDGRIEALMLNDGEYAAAGTPVARLVDNTPITVAIQVPQQNRAEISAGRPAEVVFVTGQTRTGTVTFVGTAAAAETRTFLAEVEIENEDGAIPAGVSAEVTVRTGAETAHFVEASVVSLDADGRTGIKTVEDGVVQFQEVELINADVGGLYAVGLPETVDMIVVGQGFVRAGEDVRVQSEEDLNAVAQGGDTQ